MKVGDFMLRLVLSLLSYYLYMIVKYRKSLYMLQQNSYNTSNRYVKWVFKNYNQSIITEDFLFLILIGLYYIIPLNFYYLVMILFYGVLFYLELKKIKLEQNKKPFVLTGRIKRLIVTLLLLFVTLYVLVYIYLINGPAIYCYLAFALFAYFCYLITFIANVINKPIEYLVFKNYEIKAIKRLREMSNLIKIGITGSYGKTSSKNVLNEILNQKYTSFATPKSFNTTYGLINATNNYLDKFDNVYIAEMGACKRNDIKELCDLIKPTYGIITKIGPAHLETFKTMENIVKTKFELIESLPSDGIAVLNSDDPYQVDYKIKNSCEIIWIGIENKADIMAKNISISNLGMTFDVYFSFNDDVLNLKTSLLGRANIYNILSSIAIALKLKVSYDDIVKAISLLKPVEHRLELKKVGDVIIIDDAFNSNPDGSKMALEVLDLMKGKKIIVTPGMIELGEKQYELNKRFGEYISEVVDDVILIGEKQTQPILDGLNEKHFDKDHIYILNDVKKAFSLINEIKDKNTYVLLENDLPDIFSER